MNGNEIGINFGSNLMKDGIERGVNGLAEENLGVLASLRETRIYAEPTVQPTRLRRGITSALAHYAHVPSNHSLLPKDPC
jgi:hypothetical protein